MVSNWTTERAFGGDVGGAFWESEGIRKTANERTPIASHDLPAKADPAMRENHGEGAIDAPSGVFVHATGVVDPGARIGNGSRVEAFAHVLDGAIIGRNCTIGDHVYVGSHVQIGERVDIMPGVQLGDNIVLEDDVIIGPNVTLASHLLSRSEPPVAREALKTIVRTGASLGANATIAPGIIIGRNAVVSVGAVVTNNVPPNAIVAGNPARITGYGSPSPVVRTDSSESIAPPDTIKVQGVRAYHLPVVIDMRGNLSVAEFDRHLPFIPKRYFIVFDVPSEEVRGEHAHKALHQFLVCVKGSCSLVVDDGANRAELLLDKPDFGVHIQPMVWATQYKYSHDAVLLVLASDKYDPADYIRDYDEYIEAVKSRNSASQSNKA